MKPAKREHRLVDGVLLLDKPRGLTSNGALQRVRRLYNAAKAGHTGTLDPMATGLLPLCFGEATKFAAGLLDSDKSYRAEVRLGITTSTADSEGQVLSERSVQVTRAELEVVLQGFRGDLLQTPPMHSALKRDGKPLYAYARSGIELEREARPIRIHRLSLVDFEGDLFEFDVTCSKGTYVRTLAEDIGRELGCGAHLTGLRRTRIGNLGVEQALQLDELEGSTGHELMVKLLPVDYLLTDLHRVDLPDTMAERFSNGQAVEAPGPLGCGPCRVYGPDRFLGLGMETPEGRIAPRRLVAPAPLKTLKTA